MNEFINNLKMHMSSMDRSIGQPYFGIVTSYNPATHSVKVRMQPEADTPVVSGWLPIVSPTLGNGWGIVAPPNMGEQVVVIPDSGDRNHGLVLGSIYSSHAQPPKPDGNNNVQNQEMALVHQTGTYIKLNNDGSADLFTNKDLRLHSKGNTFITADGNIVKVTGNLQVTGSITAGFGGSDQVGLQTHKHTQPADSHSDTEQPTNPPIAGT